MLSHGMRRSLVLGPLLVLMSVGCEGRPRARFGQPEDLERYAKLPLALTTHHADLRAELARVVAEGGTPAQLADAATTAGGKSTAAAVLTELSELFPADTREMLLKRIVAVYPDDQFQFSPLERQAARELLQSVDERRRNYQRLIMTPRLPLVHAHSLGMGADMGYLDCVEVGNRLVVLSCEEHLEAERLQPATDAWEALMRGAAWMSQQKHMVPRLAAVHRRHEAFSALGAIVRHPKVAREHLVRIEQVMKRELAEWPADAEAWVGERAEGLHTYELVRDGYLLSVLPFEELRQYREEIGVEKLGQAVGKNLDVDELFFLQSVRKLREVSQKSYPERRAAVEQLMAELERLRQTDQYPFLADQVLLQNLDEEQQWLALDRARAEAWWLAVRTALGEASDSPSVNPLTGQPFSVVKTDSEVVVDGIDSDEKPIRLSLKP